MEWLQQNAQLVSSLVSAGMLAIWSIYALLFYSEFKRRRRSNLFLHAAGVSSEIAECLLINLSQEPVHVICSMAVRDRHAVLLYDRSEEHLSIQARTKQGPLHAGESMSLGSFHAICRQLDASGELSSDESEQLIEVRVAAIHGAHSSATGAYRRFRLDGSVRRVEAATRATTQMRSRRQIRSVQEWLKTCWEIG